MKIALSVVATLLCLLDLPTNSLGHGSHSSCTHGKLYVFDDATSDVHVVDATQEDLKDLTIETSITLPSVGAGNLTVYGTAASPLVIQYRGQEDLGFQDGYVRVVDTGFHKESGGGFHYDAPSIFMNALIDDCPRPIHQVRHDDMIAIFCDGAFDHDPQVNTTVHVIEETLLGGTGSAVIHSLKLQGTHHGVAIPVDENHLLHSLAHPERVAGNENVTSLPATFQVVDMEGTILHELTDTTNPDTHCSGFHGSATMDNTFALACDAVHGGIVIVDYNPSSNGYTSRALAYPDDAKFEGGFRIGSFAYHKNSPYFVGSFAAFGGTEFHLVAISPSATSLEADNVLTLPSTARQCGYQFEVGSGEHLMVLLPDGVLHAFEIADGSFQQVAQQVVVPGMTTCSQAAFVVGVGQAFIATPADKTLYGVDLSGLKSGKMEVYTSTLPFTPTGMTVSGFTADTACKLSEPASPPSESGAKVVSMFGLVAMAAVVVLAF